MFEKVKSWSENAFRESLENYWSNDMYQTNQIIPPFTGLGGLIAQRLEEQLLRWLRAAELTCDRAALLVAQDPKV